jgi:hypothetical protein
MEKVERLEVEYKKVRKALEFVRELVDIDYSSFPFMAYLKAVDLPPLSNF